MFAEQNILEYTALLLSLTSSSTTAGFAVSSAGHLSWGSWTGRWMHSCLQNNFPSELQASLLPQHIQTEKQQIHEEWRGHQQEKTPRWPSRFSWKTISVTEFMLMSAAPDRKWRYWRKLEFSFWPSSIPSHLKWYYLHSKLSCVRFNEQTWQFSGAYGAVTRLARKGATVGKYDQAIKLTLSSSHYFQLLKIWHMFDEKSNSGYDNGQKQQA